MSQTRGQKHFTVQKVAAQTKPAFEKTRVFKNLLDF